MTSTDKMLVISRIKPQLVRKRIRIHIPRTVRVVVRNRTASLQEIRSRTTSHPTRSSVAGSARVESARVESAQIGPVLAESARVEPDHHGKPESQAVSHRHIIRQRRNRRNQPKVRYIARDASPESIGLIASLRGIGRGKILVLIGNGPSILEAPLEKLRNIPYVDTYVVNKPDDRLWPTTYWAFFDLSQLRRHEDLWNGYDGWIFNSTAIRRQKPKSVQFTNIGGKGWSRDLTKGLHIGRSSVFASMQIAMWMQYEHVYIFGCDMNPNVDGPLHFYGHNPDVDPKLRKERFMKEAEYYDHAADILAPEERCMFTFCSDYNPWPFVEKFGRLSHKKAVDHIIEHAARLRGDGNPAGRDSIDHGR